MDPLQRSVVWPIVIADYVSIASTYASNRGVVLGMQYKWSSPSLVRRDWPTDVRGIDRSRGESLYGEKVQSVDVVLTQFLTPVDEMKSVVRVEFRQIRLKRENPGVVATMIGSARLTAA